MRQNENLTNDFVICKYYVFHLIRYCKNFNIIYIYSNIASLSLCILHWIQVFTFHKLSDGKFLSVVSVKLKSFYPVVYVWCLRDGFLFCLDKHAYEIFRLFNAPRIQNSHLLTHSVSESNAWQQPKSIATICRNTFQSWKLTFFFTNTTIHSNDSFLWMFVYSTQAKWLFNFFSISFFFFQSCDYLSIFLPLFI